MTDPHSTNLLATALMLAGFTAAHQERASQQAAERVRLKDETDEGWRTAEARAIDALIAGADEAGRKLDASLDQLKGKSLDEMFRDEMKRIA